MWHLILTPISGSMTLV
ncbi:unnamed protein product [Linum tenue]|uniref:Uncharacterized protein n=1 Tax=Linum tenue TaxID=586396 RepID=A0AAV0HVF6_9ROSI|nr:unnamed protein product [Linum tenue]